MASVCFIRPSTAYAHYKSSVKSQYFDTRLLHLSAAMTGQSVIKHFLTEGDKFLVSRLSPLADQGGYAVASNYGMFKDPYVDCDC